MADFTAEQYRNAAKKALAAGDSAAAKRLIAAGRAMGPSAGERAMNRPVLSPSQIARQKAIDDKQEVQMNDPGALRSLLAGANQGLTFGFGDEMSAGLASLSPSVTYDQALGDIRGELDNARAARPVTTTGAEIAGAVALPLGAMGSGGSLGARMGKSALTAGGMSGAYGFGAGEGGFTKRVEAAIPQAGVGAVIGAAIPVAGSALQTIMNNRAANKAITQTAKGAPTTEALRAQGNALYQQVDDAGVQIAPQAFDRARGSILDDLRANTGFDELPGPGSLTPNTARVNQIMGDASGKMAAEPTAALPFKALDQMRRQAGAAAGNVTNKADQQAGMTVINGLDDFVQKLQPGDVVAGDIQALNDALPKAREVWQRMSKSQMVDDAITAGGDYLSGASSGIRNQFKNILRNKKLAGRFTAAEQTAMRKVVNGSIPEQLLNLASGGIGQMATAIGGGVMGGIPGFLGGAAAAAATRKMAEKVTTGKAETLRGLIANGGLKQLPTAPTALRDLIEQRMRLGTAATIQHR